MQHLKHKINIIIQCSTEKKQKIQCLCNTTLTVSKWSILSSNDHDIDFWSLKILMILL